MNDQVKVDCLGVWYVPEWESWRMDTEFYSEKLKEEANGGGVSESMSEGNTKIGTSGNPQRNTQRRIREHLNP